MDLLRRYRILLIICVLAGLRGWWEVTSPDRKGDKDPPGFSTLVSEMYPQRAEALYNRGYSALSGHGDLAQARRLFEQAIATGVKTDEQLLYNYAVILVHLDEDPEIVDAAVADWRWNFPDSKLPDPRNIPQGSRAKSRLPENGY